MTSSNEPQKESLRDRISTRLSTDKSGRLIDAEAQHTRNISWMFAGIVIVIIVIIVGGLLYGFWESNLKPVASVGGTDVSRGDVEDRAALAEFRYDRANAQTSSALAEGTIDSDLANRRFSVADNDRPATDAAVVTGLVDLLFAEQLAETENVTLTDEELQAAVEADGAFAEVRQVDALVVLTDEQEQGLAATDVGIADARERAQAAADELAAGGDPTEIAETHGPANYETGWVTYDDLIDLAWAEEIFAAEEGEVTAPVGAETGEQLIALVKGIVPEQPDPGFLEAVGGEVGADYHRRNVELETLADKLEAQVAADALATEYDQVRLAEIFLERSPASSDDTIGEVRASHILYQPETPLDEEGNATELADLPEDDPAWDAAEAEAQAALDDLSAIEDADERSEAFAGRARDESDGPSGPTGGDLGWFPREAMVSEFSDALFENVDPQHGDVLGPVRTEFGWHVILFDSFRSSLDVRVSDAQAALAEDGAGFAEVATEYSDGSEAAEGGELGWQVIDLLDDETFLALTAIEVGEATEPVDGGDGFRIYEKQEEAARPLEAAAAASLQQTAFSDWYDEIYSAAVDDGTISIDESVYE